eukprot:3939508-Rhodomonas_salina.3
MQAKVEELAARLIFYKGLIPMTFGATTVGFAIYSSRCAIESHKARLVGREAEKRLQDPVLALSRNSGGKIAISQGSYLDGASNARDVGTELQQDPPSRNQQTGEHESGLLRLDKRGMTDYARQMQAHSMTVSSLTVYTALTCAESFKDFMVYRKLSLNEIGSFFLTNKIPLFRAAPLGVLGITLAGTVMQCGEVRLIRPQRAPLIANSWARRASEPR